MKQQEQSIEEEETCQLPGTLFDELEEENPLASEELCPENREPAVSSYSLGLVESSEKKKKFIFTVFVISTSRFSL